MAVSFDLPMQSSDANVTDQILHLRMEADDDLRIADVDEASVFFVRYENIQAFAEAVSAIAAELKKVENDNG